MTKGPPKKRLSAFSSLRYGRRRMLALSYALAERVRYGNAALHSPKCKAGKAIVYSDKTRIVGWTRVH